MFDNSSEVKFYLLLVLLIPSALCSLVLLYYLIKSRRDIWQNRQQDHILCCLILCAFIQAITELPLTLKFLSIGRIPHESDSYCYFWIIYNYTLTLQELLLITSATIERYVLVFYRPLFAKKRFKFLFHYLPMLVSIFYPPIYYTLMALVYPWCTQQFSYTSFVCAGLCYQVQLVSTTLDCFLNYILPVVVTTGVNLLIAVKVLRQKRRMKQQNTWKKNIKMVVQLMWISLIFILAWIPMVISILLVTYVSESDQNWFLSFSMDYLGYATYLAVLLCPFVGVMALPEIREKMMAAYCPLKRTNNRINTVTATRQAAFPALKMTTQMVAGDRIIYKIAAVDLQE